MDCQSAWLPCAWDSPTSNGAVRQPQASLFSSILEQLTESCNRRPLENAISVGGSEGCKAIDHHVYQCGHRGALDAGVEKIEKCIMEKRG